MNRPGPSIVQPPAGFAFDVFAAILHFFLSINPSWMPPEKLVDERAELEALMAENTAAVPVAQE